MAACLCLDPPLELFVQRSIALVVRAICHWLGGKREKVKSLSPASSRLSATGRRVSRHLRRNALRRPPLPGRVGVDHVGVIGGDLLVELLGGVGQEIAMLVNRAALDRHAFQRTAIAFSSPGAPATMTNLGRRKPRATSRPGGRARPRAFAAHARDASSTFWPSRERQGPPAPRRRSPSVEPHADHGAVEDEPDDGSPARIGLSTRPSRSSPCARPGSPHPCRSRRRTGRRARGAPGGCWCRQDRLPRSAHRHKREPLIGRERLVPPLRRPAISPGQPGARDRSRPGRRCHQRPRRWPCR